MVYRKKKTRWKKARYPKYFENVSELLSARKEAVFTLGKILGIKSQEYWISIIPILQSMKQELDELGEIPEKSKSIPVIKYCLRFLDIASRYQDELDGGIKFAPKSKLDIVAKFNQDLTFAGRHTKDEHMQSISGNAIPFWNTTSKGEPITEDNIFFGPDIGLLPRSARYWINLKKSKTVNITITKNYEKGSLRKKPVPMWATGALVKYSSIFSYCKIGHKCLTQHLDNILA